MARARFVSRYGNYSVGVQSKVEEHYGTGEGRVLKRRIDAQFQNHLVSEEDFAVALASFVFNGLPHDEETNQNISPRYRVSVWDSEWAKANEGFSDEEIDLIIEKLRTDPMLGPDHLEVDVASKAPFQNYDNLSVPEVLKVIELTGTPVESVIAYERENANRSDLLKRLEGVEASDDAVVVSA